MVDVVVVVVVLGVVVVAGLRRSTTWLRLRMGCTLALASLLSSGTGAPSSGSLYCATARDLWPREPLARLLLWIKTSAGATLVSVAFLRCLAAAAAAAVASFIVATTQRLPRSGKSNKNTGNSIAHLIKQKKITVTRSTSSKHIYEN